MEQPRQNINLKVTDQSSASSVPTTPTLPPKNRGNKRNVNVNVEQRRSSRNTTVPQNYEIIGAICIVIITIAIFGFAMNSVVFRTTLLLIGITAFTLAIVRIMSNRNGDE